MHYWYSVSPACLHLVDKVSIDQNKYPVVPQAVRCAHCMRNNVAPWRKKAVKWLFKWDRRQRGCYGEALPRRAADMEPLLGTQPGRLTRIWLHQAVTAKLQAKKVGYKLFFSFYALCVDVLVIFLRCGGGKKRARSVSATGFPSKLRYAMLRYAMLS